MIIMPDFTIQRCENGTVVTSILQIRKLLLRLSNLQGVKQLVSVELGFKIVLFIVSKYFKILFLISIKN